MKDTEKFGEIAEMCHTLVGVCQRETHYVRAHERDGLEALRDALTEIAEAADRAQATGDYRTLKRFASVLAAASVPGEVAFAGAFGTDEQEGE